MLFFFKQKTAYDMRIRDWSSYVGSSDFALNPRIIVSDQRLFFPFPVVKIGIQHAAAISELQFSNSAFPNIHAGPPQQIYQFACIGANQSLRHLPIGRRSDENTSDLQSQMRISYAVFCLKKKNTTQTHTSS